MRHVFLAVAVAITVTIAPALSVRARADEAATARGDLALLQGSWAGQVGPEKNVPIKYTFVGDSVTIRIMYGGVNGREITLKGKVRLDESAKPEKAVDWLNLADASGKSLPQQPGIYALEGTTTLKIRNARDPKTRPDGFADVAGAPATLVLTRLAEAPQEKGKEPEKTRNAEKSPAPAPAPCDVPKEPAKVKDKDKGKDKDKADAPKGDLGKLQGRWSTLAGADKNLKITILFTGAKIEATFAPQDGEERTAKGEVVVNDAATPKTIDFVNFVGPNGNEIEPNLAIYTLEADQLTVCAGGPGKERPTEFKDGDGGMHSLLIFNRIK